MPTTIPAQAHADWQSVFANSDQRRLVAGIMADTISRAHAHSPSCWMLKYVPGRPYLNINIGRAFAFSVRRASLTVLLDQATIPPGVVRDTWRGGGDQDAFKSIDGLNWIRGPVSEILAVWDQLQDCYFRGVDRAIDVAGLPNWWRQHDQIAVQMLAEQSGRNLPAPQYPAMAAGGDASLEELIGEFATSYPLSADGRRHAEQNRQALEAFTKSFEELRRRRASGQEVTVDVLTRLLPHLRTDKNIERGAWITTAPVLKTDIRKFLEASGKAKPGDWPTVAGLIMDLFETCAGDPAELPAACAQFVQKNPIKGMQAALLSPGLNAINPKAFAVINAKPLAVVQRFLGVKRRAKFAEYPQANAEVMKLVEQATEGLADIEELEGLPTSMRFDMFTHWFVAVREEPTDGYWIFQANPTRFDLAKELHAEGSEAIDTWSVSRHVNDIMPGDRVLLWQSGAAAGVYAEARITGAVVGVTEEDADDFSPAGGHRVPIEVTRILDQPLRRDAIMANPALAAMTIITSPTGTNFRVKEDEWKALRRMLDAPTGPTLDQIAEETSLEPQDLARWLAAIERKGQAVLYGPPGTGKTFVAERLAQYLVGSGDGFVELVQFHPAYAYEDFIQGLRPVATSAGGLDYRMLPGRFLQFCRRAAATQGTCVLILDEINRANLARVFGELMYLLEYRGQEVPLAAGGTLSIPANVRIIGTMNTADRSIALVDHALRRRFAFIHLRPQLGTLLKYHHKLGRDASGLVEVLQAANQKINDPHYHLGISYFMREDLPDHLEDIWRMEIEPYLEEYFFDRPAMARELAWDVVKDKLA